LTNSKKISTDALKKTKDQLVGLDIQKLRSLTSNYVADWLQTVSQLIDSEEVMNPTYGQSLEEEYENSSLENWTTFDGDVVPVSSFKYRIRNSDLRLFGGPQIERLLSVMKIIISNPDNFKVDLKDFDVILKTNSLENALNSASHLIIHKSKSYYHSVEQLCNRANAILKRVSSMAFSVMEKKDKRSLVGSSSNVNAIDIQDLQGFGYFCYSLRDVYFEYVDKVTAACKVKCLEEISTLDLINWDASQLSKYPSDQPKRREYIQNIATKYLVESNKNVVSNLLLIAHHYFLFNCPKDLSGEILKDVSSFSEKMLEEMFELSNAKKKELSTIQSNIEADLDLNAKQENQLRDLNGLFVRMKL